VAAAPFAFQIFVEAVSHPKGENAKEQSVFVEVSPEALMSIPGGQNKDRAEPDTAERIAVEAAVEAIQKDLPDTIKLDRSVAHIGELPLDVRGRPATLRKLGVRVWAV
jgi:hypothetical protein